MSDIPFEERCEDLLVALLRAKRPLTIEQLADEIQTEHVNFAAPLAVMVSEGSVKRDYATVDDKLRRVYFVTFPKHAKNETEEENMVGTAPQYPEGYGTEAWAKRVGAWKEGDTSGDDPEPETEASSQ